MFGWLKRKNKEQSEKLIEYSFIWYKKMENGNTTHYTKPFRTKVKARNYEEAKEKVEKFALAKMKLVIMSEDGFDKSDLSDLNRSFDDLNKQYEKMDSIFKKYNRFFKS